MERYLYYGRLYFFLLFFLYPAVRADCFAVDEKLEYNLSWGGITAGSATLEVTNTADSLKIVSTAKSSDWVSLFYTVEDRAESVVSPAPAGPPPGMPLYYRIKLREGRHRRDKEVIFDHHRNKAHCSDFLRKEKNEIDIHGTFFDPLSCFYHVRTLPVVVGKSLRVNVFDSNKLSNVEVKVLRTEKVRTPAGDFETIVIKPLFKSEGLFSRKGDIYIWLTNDTKRIPVKLQTKVKLGWVTATLAGGRY